MKQIKIALFISLYSMIAVWLLVYCYQIDMSRGLFFNIQLAVFNLMFQIAYWTSKGLRR